MCYFPFRYRTSFVYPFFICRLIPQNVNVVCGDPRSAAHQMYRELSVLRGFVNGLETGEVSWFVREGSRTMAEELEEMFATIKEKGLLLQGLHS